MEGKQKGDNKDLYGKLSGRQSIAARQHYEKKMPADYEQLFPFRLHYLIEMLEHDGMGHICSFQPHGRAFVVHDQNHFVKELLPKWFNQKLWTSFQRQLNLYEFKRISSGRDKGAYYHPFFLKGRPDLCCFIKRVKIKGTGPRQPRCDMMEPDFYSMSPLTLTRREIATSVTQPHTEEVERGKSVNKMPLLNCDCPAPPPPCPSFHCAPLPPLSSRIGGRRPSLPNMVTPRVSSMASAGSDASRSDPTSPFVYSHSWLELMRQHDEAVQRQQLLMTILRGADDTTNQQSSLLALQQALANSHGILPNGIAFPEQRARIASTQTGFRPGPGPLSLSSPMIFRSVDDTATSWEHFL